MNNIVLAFDFGTSSIGVAIGQKITYTASPLNALKVQSSISYTKFIDRVLKEWQPDEVIVGLPLNMDGTEQTLTTRVRRFANEIHKEFKISVKLHDERLSTAEARSILFEYGGFRALNKSVIDSVSAVIILESYFYNQKIFNKSE